MEGESERRAIMNILLTNDDGIHAGGLWALYEALGQEHTVFVIAPDRERSAVGHGITLHQPLRVERVMVNGGFEGFAVNGTPADCVKLGLMEILERKPDLVVAGINPGINVGINLNYSGTVAAAKEAAMFGIAAIAASIMSKTYLHYQDAARFIAGLCREIESRGLPAGTFLNVNFPNLPLVKTRGVRLSRQGVEVLAEGFEKRTDPRNQTYYWQGCDTQTPGNPDDTDYSVVHQDYISITPIKCDMTDYGLLSRLKAWESSVLVNDFHRPDSHGQGGRHS
jgi:5'-nucleotidase